MSMQGRMIDLVAPGFRGLNSSEAGTILSPEYCTTAQNAILDESGRLSARDGYTIQTTTPVTANEEIKTVFEYRQGSGSTSLVVAWDGGIANSITDPQNNDISGVVTDTNGRWWFQNYFDKVVGFQNGQKPIVWTGTGNFATVTESAGTAPTVKNGIAMAAYGRIYALDSDGQTIKYSGLADETDWGTVGDAGQIDMSNIWTNGMDTVTAIAPFNGSIVVFGNNHIVFMASTVGSAIGFDPEAFYVADVVEGTGCMTQWSIQHVGESDLLFLSRNGVQSLSRLIQEKSNPINNQSRNVRTELLGDANGESDKLLISSFYSPELGVYVLTFPTAGRSWVFDQRYKWRDNEGFELATITTWTLAPSAWCVRINDDILLGVLKEVGLYGGTDDDGASYRFIWQSPWLDLGEQLANRIKMLKRLSAILFIQDEASILIKWGEDFQSDFKSRTKTLAGDGGALFGVAKFNEDEFSGGLSLRILKFNASGSAQYYRFAIEGDITGTFAFQQLELFAKIGRMA